MTPVRDVPERAFDLDNLQTLCGACHGAKTRLECGHAPLPPERQKWRDLLRMQLQSNRAEEANDA